MRVLTRTGRMFDVVVRSIEFRSGALVLNGPTQIGNIVVVLLDAMRTRFAMRGGVLKVINRRRR
jgi:hypothetical protein